MDIRVLGPAEIVDDDGRHREVGPPKVRMLLAILVLAEGRPVSPAAMVDRLWGRDAPAEASASLHAYVSNLRRVLEPDRRPRTPSRLLVLGPAGYTLRVDPGRMDAVRFLRLVDEAGRAGDPAGVERATAEALALWRGEPYADLDGQEYAVAAQARLAEARERARELRVAAVIEQGRPAEVLGDLEALTREHPLRERLWGLRALALYRCGRQGEALDALRAARRVLAEELGVDPGEDLRTLERDILAQAPSLTLDRPVPTAHLHATAPAEPPALAEPPEPAELPAEAHPAPSAGGGPAARRRLVGRRAELATLEGVLREVAGGEPGFVLITGEPGIGKTRLSEEMVSRAQALGFTVAVGRCAATEGAPAFWPWATVLERLAGMLPPQAPEIRDNLPGAGSATAMDPEGSRFRTYQAAARVLAAAAAVKPVLVVLDDLHWADPSSLRLLGYLAETFTGGPLAVVGTARVQPPPEGALADAFEALSRRHAVRLPLAGLSTADLGGLAPEGTSPQVLRALRDRSDGNPFFVTELVRYMSTGADPRGVLPLGVRDVVLGRVGRLPGPSAELLPVAAVTGREFEAAVVAEVADLTLDETLDRLEPALTGALVTEGRPGRFRFVHALVQEALLDAVPRLRRARLHARIAEALETGKGGPASGRLATVAHHWLLAVPAGHAPRAWRAARRAAREAMGLRAYDVAADLLGRAVAVAEGDPELTPADRMDLMLALADARLGAGDAQGQRALLDDVRRLAREVGDRRRRIAAATGFGGRILRPWEEHGHYDPGLLADLAELAADPGLDRASRARVLACLAIDSNHHPASTLAERDRVSGEAVELARGAGDPVLLGWALHKRYFALQAPDGVRQRIAAAEEMVAVGRAEGDEELLTIGLTCLSGALFEITEIGRARKVLEEATALVERLRVPYVRVILGWLRLSAVVLTGDLAAAEELFETVSAEHRATSMWGAEVSISAGVLQLALARIRAGTFDEETLDALGRWDGPLADAIKEAYAALLVTAGRTDRAREVVGPWESQPPIPEGFPFLHHIGMRAEVWARLGDRRACAELYEQILPYADRMAMSGLSTMQWPLSRSLCLLARALGDLDAAAEHGEHALAVSVAMDAHDLVAPVAADLAGIRRSRGGPGDAARAAELDVLAARARPGRSGG
ncbi:BTAD domain-containing putative transcriptional regulator [Streptosporangium fragile]|uniref:BTAD domain-containing putative transcriptional regulator n=1 Tax=Streptosporangium fragile TaxID=46186 RepID=A0ABN3VR94_9ACTN